MRTEVRIADRTIGPGHPAYLVAELSGNHDGSRERALATIRAAAEAGADAVKLQTYTADSLTIDCDDEDFVVPGTGPWGGRRLYDLYEEAHTPSEWHQALFDAGAACGVPVFSTPFDEEALELLERLGCPAYKVASFELVDDRLLQAVARKRKPVILSTGLANEEELVHAVDTLRAAGCEQLILLRCTSSYPAQDSDMNLAALGTLAELGRCPIGLSDHSLGIVAPVVAVAHGAAFIEKHFTLSRADGGVDSHFSLEPAEFRELVTAVRRAEAMIGRQHLGPGPAEAGSAVFRRSLYVVSDVVRGERFTTDNVRSIRPGFGLAPRHLEAVLGRSAARALGRGSRLTWADVQPSDTGRRSS